MSEQKKPNPCPDNAFVETEIFRLLSVHCHSGNKEAFTHGGLLRFCSRRGIAKLLAHYEIFKIVANLPGHIVELGVFRGDSLLRFAQFSEIFSVYDRSFDVIGFDNFEGFPSLHELDGKKIVAHDKQAGGWSSEKYRDELFELINVFDNDRFAPQKARIKIIEGDILKTVPKYAEENPGLVFKILHLDADLYEPTKCALEHLWDRLVVGGVLLLDEYGFDLFPGEATAVDEFFRQRGINTPVKKFPFTDNPGGFVIKETR